MFMGQFERGRVMMGRPNIDGPRQGTEMKVPCGRCFGCRAEYAQQWALRCEHESKMHDVSHFITLTYDDEHLPWHRGLILDDLQRFLKRFRKRLGPIRYFACGEYGAQSGRPHWHAILFGSPLVPSGPADTANADLSALWPLGRHQLDGFSPGRAAYVAGYVSKKLHRSQWDGEVFHPETGELFTRRQEFVTMSRKPAIGHTYLERYRSDFLRGFATLPGGTKGRLPRYYRRFLENDPDWALLDQGRREDYAFEHPDLDSTPDRLAARDAVHRAKISTYRQERGL